jgi:hypothetical protein
LTVPVPSGLKSERQYERGNHDGCNPVRHLPSLEQPNTPTPMLLRRSFQHNRDDNFSFRATNRQILDLQHIAIPGDHFVQHRIYKKTKKEARN